jgi:hypothetical protein
MKKASLLLLILLIFTPALMSGENDTENNSDSSGRSVEDKSAVQENNTATAAESKNLIDSTADAVNSNKTHPDDKNTKKAVQVPAPVSKTLPVFVNDNGLLEINEDDLKYRRIPGITIHKKRTVTKQPEEIKNIPDDRSDNRSLKAEEPKGLFGLKKSTSGIIIKILLICFIVAIIILFKVRPKIKGNGKNGKVVRRFP